MKRLSEETLNAYVDGALDAGARAEVEAHLATDAEARALLERLCAADRLAVEAFVAPLREPPPRALVDAILNAPAPRGAPATGAVSHDASRGTQPGLATRVRWYALPLAACLVLAVGLGAGALLGQWLAQPPSELSLGPVPGESVLHRLLERQPSGSALEMRGSQRVGVVATFIDRHARPCREVEILPAGSDQQPIAAAVACREGSGQWLVEGATRLAGSSPAPGVKFEPSGVPEKDALDGLLTLLGAQQALGPAEEKALMARGWRKG
jgi:hypothetical protein